MLLFYWECLPELNKPSTKGPDFLQSIGSSLAIVGMNLQKPLNSISEKLIILRIFAVQTLK